MIRWCRYIRFSQVEAYRRNGWTVKPLLAPHGARFALAVKTE